MKTRKKLTEQINKLQGELAALERKQVSQIYGKLVEETLNLLSGVGEGYIDEDYYAPDRYYSSIDGVKNIRISGNDDVVTVKLYQNIILPNTIEVDGKIYSIKVIYSKNYSHKIIN